MNAKYIFTVIIIDGTSTELSTAAFAKFRDALNYCLVEMDNRGDVSEEEMDDVKDTLKDQMYYDAYGTTYYIEETKFIG